MPVRHGEAFFTKPEIFYHVGKARKLKTGHASGMNEMHVRKSIQV
jgi:hypothetical protein